MTAPTNVPNDSNEIKNTTTSSNAPASTTATTATATTATAVTMLPPDTANSMMASFGVNNAQAGGDQSMDVDELERLLMGDTGDEHGGFDLTNEIDIESLTNSGFFSNFSGFMGSDPQLPISFPAQVLKPRATLTGHTNKVATCAFSISGRWLASAGHDKKILLWSFANGQLQHTLTGHSGHINSARFSPDTRDLLATASYDKTVRIWHSINGTQPECAMIYNGHQGNVTAVDFCSIPNSDMCYSVDAEGELQVWSINTGLRSKTIRLQSSGSSKYTGYSSNPLRSRPGHGSIVAVAQATMLIIIDVNQCPDGLVTSSNTGVRVLSTPHQKNIGQLDWSLDAVYLVTASEDAVCVWDATTFKPLHTQTAQTGKIASCCFVSEPVTNGNGNAITTTTSRIAFGEYESIYLWRFRDTLTSTTTTTTTTATNGFGTSNERNDTKGQVDTPALSVTTVQSGMVNCLAPLIALKEDGSGTFAVCLASGSGHRDSNLKLWDVLDQRPTTTSI
ncbi:WD40-repeat-containing domain protein [Syncephalis plumigaleata]|nr:WD40-repeat-containing domain protein [Syncephalis plumigaleata]